MGTQDAPTLAQLETVLGPEENESAADTMRNVMAEAEATAGTGEDETGSDASDASVDAGQSRQRDPATGRFTKSDTDDAGGTGGTGEGEGEAEGQDKGQGEAEPEGEENQDPLDPPVEWAVEQQEAFRALPRVSQQFLLDRFGETSDLQKKAGEAQERYDGVYKLLEPRKEAWAREGMDEVTGVRQLLALSDYATQQPLEFVQMFIRERGLDPQAVLGVQPATTNDGADPATQDTPEMQVLHGQIAALMDQVQTLQGGFETRQQHEEQQAQASLENQIQQFSTETDDKGKLKHPYFNEVRGLMAPLMGSGQASDLQHAYDMACRAHPDVSAKIASAAKADAERERARKDREKAEAARKAGTSISGDPGEGSKPQPTGDLREDMRREFQERGMLP